jgi:hypothetical protein
MSVGRGDGRFRCDNGEVHDMLQCSGEANHVGTEDRDTPLDDWHEGNYTVEKNMPGGVKKGEKFVNNNCRHLRNERTLATRGVRPIDEAIQDIVGEKARKQQQMGIIFHLLSTGRPMVDFSSIRPMLQFLAVPKLAKRHWSDGAGWVLAECIFRQVEAKALEMVRSARFISLSCDEVTSIDNGSWISIHCYVVQNWSRVPILISLQHV